MSNPSLDPEMLISRLSYRPLFLLKAMIKIPDPPAPANSTPSDRVSSLGMLDRLPPETMSILLGMLDIQSIARFASVSYQGYLFVQSQRTYRDLVTVAPQVLAALSRTGLNGLHSVNELHTALRMERCAKCIEYGAFLFLPTCERCCWQCLRENPSLRVIPPLEAKQIFGLSDHHLRYLPTLRVIPGEYGRYPKYPKPAPENCRLVGVKAARALGLEVYRSAENLAQAQETESKPTTVLVPSRYLQSEPVVSQSQDLLLLPTQCNIPPDDFFGMASIPFPSLSKSGKIEDGLWCRGCVVTYRHYGPRRLPKNVLAAVVPSNCRPHRVLLGLERRARSRESFLDHIKHCYGARRFVPELATGNDCN